MLRRLSGALRAGERGLFPRIQTAGVAMGSRLIAGEGMVECRAARTLSTGLWTGNLGSAVPRGFAVQGMGLLSPVQPTLALQFAVGSRGYAAVKMRQKPGHKKPKKTKMKFPRCGSATHSHEERLARAFRSR